MKDLKRPLIAWSIAALLLVVSFVMPTTHVEIMRLPRAFELPVMASVGVVLDLPPELRTRNWGGGSCVHASTTNLLKWMELYELAAWWRNTYSGGEYDTRLIARMEQAGLRYAYVHGGVDRDGNGVDDYEDFLEWCTRTRRGAGIFYKPMHSINCVGMDEQYVYLLDNNATNYPEQYGHYERVPRREFFRKSREYGSFAWTLIYDPTPPRPYIGA
jgi:hypothetical protein